MNDPPSPPAVEMIPVQLIDVVNLSVVREFGTVSGDDRREDLAHLLIDVMRPCRDAASVGLDGLSFDPFSFKQDGLAASEVDVGRRQIADALVVAQVIVVGDEGADLGLEIARQVVVLEQDAVLERLVPALDLALGLGMIAARRGRDPCPGPRAIRRGRRRCSSSRCRSTAAAGERPWLDRGPRPSAPGSSVSVTSSAFIVVHSFQAMM